MNLPNKITIARICLIPIMVIITFFHLDDVLYLNITTGNLILLIIFLIGSLTDYLDGHIARKNNIVTDFGKFLDPLADKLLVCSTFVYLIQIGRFDYFNISWAFVFTIIIAREFAVTGLRLIAVQNNGKVMAAKILGKAKTMTQMITIIVLLLNSFGVQIIGFVLLMLSMILTVVSGVDYFVKSKDVLKEQK